MFEEKEDAQEVSSLIGKWEASTSRKEVVFILRLVEKYVKVGDQFSTEFSTKLTAPHAKNPSNGASNGAGKKRSTENTTRRAMFDGALIGLFAKVIKPGFHPAAVESDESDDFEGGSRVREIATSVFSTWLIRVVLLPIWCAKAKEIWDDNNTKRGANKQGALSELDSADSVRCFLLLPTHCVCVAAAKREIENGIFKAWQVACITPVGILPPKVFPKRSAAQKLATATTKCALFCTAANTPFRRSANASGSRC